jgi:outer membrane biosynthesis protein TonB
MRTYSLLLIPLAALLSAAAPREDIVTFKEASEKHLLLKAVRPEYYVQARKRHLVGSGVFDVKFDYESGHLREIHIVRTIPEPMLQLSAITALKQWQAKPRSIHTMRVSMTFMYGPPFREVTY